jgi:TonB family protein
MAYKAAIVILLFAWSASAVAQEQIAPPKTLTNKDNDERSAKFGDLVVTTSKMVTSPLLGVPDRREVTVFLTVNNTGNGVVCASFNAKLKTTFGLEYLGTYAQAPPMREMLPGESSQGSYVFNVKDGVQPLELVLELQGGTIRCKTSGDEPLPGVSVPSQIRLNVSDLPGSNANDPRPKGAFRSGVGGVTYPSCLYCPEPSYTEKARGAKLQGTVQLKVVVGTDGNATNIEIVKGIGLGLDEEAVKAVQSWRFKPALGPNGEPIATITPIVITFRLR